MDKNIRMQNQDKPLIDSVTKFLQCSQQYDYSKNMFWMGMQTMQYPEDLIALQEILWKTKPGVVIATGVANGGTLIFISSIMRSYIQSPLVIGIDPFVSSDTKRALCSHVYGDSIRLVEASSTTPQSVQYVKTILSNTQCASPIMVVLDSMHDTEHVSQEIQLWKDFVSINCYLLVCWTVIGECDDVLYKTKLWGKESNPLIAVRQFLEAHPEFHLDNSFERKYLITSSGKGFLKRII